MTKHDDLLVIIYRIRDRLEAIRHKLVLGQTDHESATDELESCHKIIEDILDSKDYEDVWLHEPIKMLVEHAERSVWSALLSSEDCAQIIPAIKDFQDEGHRRMLRSHLESSAENAARQIKTARESLHVAAYRIRGLQSQAEKNHVET